MKSKFLKNSIYMSTGTLFKFFIAFLSTAIYVRTIGTDGYAILGIVFSLFILISKLDLPYFLSLVKYNSDYYGKKRYLFESMFSTLYNSVLFGNILLFLFLFPLIIFLSTKIYNNQNLISFYFIATLIFLIMRVNSFLKTFLRANSREVIIQRSLMPSLTLEFLSTIILLLVFKFGVMSIFVGAFIGTSLEYFLLWSYTKAFVKYRLYFSLSLFIKTFKKYTFQSYLSVSLSTSVLYGGLFVSTFYLDIHSLGVLTIIISIMNIIRELYFPVSIHLVPIYSSLIIKNNYRKIKKIISNITPLLLFLFIVAMIFFATIGKPLYTIYFGNKMNGTYFIFLIMVSSLLFYFSFVAITSYIFIYSIKSYNILTVFSILIFYIILISSIKTLGLIGIIISYFALYVLHALLCLSYVQKVLSPLFDRRLISLIVFATIFFIFDIIFISEGIFFNLTLAIFFFVTVMSIILVLYAKRLAKMLKYTIRHI